jgi:hypothetical protein
MHVRRMFELHGVSRFGEVASSNAWGGLADSYYLLAGSRCDIDADASRGLLGDFAELEDRRLDRTNQHCLADILAIAICAVICGANGQAARRIRQGHAAENFARLGRVALNLLKAEAQEKAGIKTQRLTCGWDHDNLLKVLTGGN